MSNSESFAPSTPWGEAVIMSQGALAATEADDTLSATGTGAIQGTLSSTEANDTATATGAAKIQGILAQTEADDTLDAAGKDPITAAGDVTEADDTLSAAARALVRGVLAATEADDGTTATTGTISTPTAYALRRSRSNKLAFVILIEGIDIAFTTSEDVDGISTAWAGTDWDPSDVSWQPTAFLPGAWSQQIELFNPKIRADSLSFRVLDRRDYLAKLILGANAQNARTYLTADMDNSTNVMLVQETGGFTESGDFDIYVGNETIRVSSGFQGPNGWTSVERARWALHETDDGTPFAPAHRKNTINGLAPRVTDKATAWYNRHVAIYLHHYEAGTRTWSAAGQALLVWEGMLRPVRDNGDRSFTFTAVHVADLLNRQLLDQQFVADMRPGLYVPEGQNYFAAIEDTALGTVVYETTFAAGWYTADDLAAALNAKLVASVSGLKLAWSVGRGSSGRVRIQASVQPGDSYATSVIAQGGKLWARMSALAGLLLGFSVSNNHNSQEAGVTYAFGTIDVRYQRYDSGINTAYFWHDAEAAPAKYFFGFYDFVTPLQLHLINAAGAPVPQPVLSTGEGVPAANVIYLMVGDMRIVGGSYDAGSGVFTVVQLSVPQFSELGFVPREDQITLGTVLRESDMAGTLQVKQVWYEKAPVGDVALRLILSTGTSGYNHATYDVNPAGMGAGVPASLIDIPAFQTLGHGALWTLAVTGPREMGRELESMLATFGRHLVWRAGKLTLVEPRVDGPSIAVAFTLDDDNKTRTDDRIASDFGIDGIINRVEVKYNRDLSGSFRAQPLIAEDLVSQSDFGIPRTVSIEAWGVQNLSGDGMREQLAVLLGRILALSSRPMVVIERTISMQLIQIVPGDLVLLTDPYVLDPKTGTRGVVHFPAWVLSMSFDPAARAGKVRIAYSPEFPTDKICPWAWSMRVKATAPNGGYTVVSGSSRYLDVEPDHYQASRQAADDTAAAAGDVVTIRELSPADPFAPLSWTVTVSSVDTAAHRVYVSAELAGWDPDRAYVVTPADITEVQHAQLINTFIADDATDSTGYNTNDSYVYGVPLADAGRGDARVTQAFCTPPRDGTAKTAGKPLAVADVFEAWRSASSLRAYRTRHLAISQVWTHGAAFTSTTDRELIVPPIWVPLYAYGSRNLLVRLFGKTTNGSYSATFRVTAAKSMPEGTTNTGPVIFRDPNPGQTEIVCTYTDLTWLAEISLPCYPELGGAPPGIWLCVEAQVANVAASAVLGGISVFEAAGT